jgi:hypothetical protein
MAPLRRMYAVVYKHGLEDIDAQKMYSGFAVSMYLLSATVAAVKQPIVIMCSTLYMANLEEIPFTRSFYVLNSMQFPCN